MDGRVSADARPFVVSVRLPSTLMDLLDVAVDLEGIPRGTYVGRAFQDWVDGIVPGDEPVLRCWRALQDARKSERILSRRSWIADWKRSHHHVRKG